MEVRKAIEAAAIAGKLRAAAMDYRRTADSLERAADRYTAKGRQALAETQGIAGDLDDDPHTAIRGMGGSAPIGRDC